MDDGAELMAVSGGAIMSCLYRGRAKIEEGLLCCGKENSHVPYAPEKAGARSIDLEGIFGLESQAV